MSTQTVYVVDDDPSIRRAIESAGHAIGVPVVSFSTAEQFLEGYEPDRPGCAIIDIRMPGLSGIELQQWMAARNWELPVIIISGHADVRLAVEVMRAGAVTLLEKPFQLDELVTQVRRALALDDTRRMARAKKDAADKRLTKLTAKEFEVFDLVARGWTNKQIAGELSLSVRAVEDRRSRLMRKLDAQSIADLVQLRLQMTNPSEQLELPNT